MSSLRFHIGAARCLWHRLCRPKREQEEAVSRNNAERVQFCLQDPFQQVDQYVIRFFKALQIISSFHYNDE